MRQGIRYASRRRLSMLYFSFSLAAADGAMPLPYATIHTPDSRAIGCLRRHAAC